MKLGERVPLQMFVRVIGDVLHELCDCPIGILGLPRGELFSF